MPSGPPRSRSLISPRLPRARFEAGACILVRGPARSCSFNSASHQWSLLRMSYHSPAPMQERQAVRRRHLTLAAMCIAQGMALLDVTIINTALPSIQQGLNLTPGQLEWVINAYVLG